MDARSQSARRAEIEQRLRFEMLLADVCAQFVNVAPNDLGSKIENAQRLICESLKVNHSSVWQVLEDDPELLGMTHAYRDPKLKPLPSRPVLREFFPWSQNQILNKQIVCVPDTAKLPPEAAKDMESWLQYGIRSTLAFPLSVGGGSVIGLLAFDSTEERDWPEPLQRRLQILALVFAQALDRKHSEQKVRIAENALRAGEERLRLAQQAARIGTFELNIRTGVNTWTAELEAMYGLPPGGFGGTQTAFENLVHPDDRGGVIELVKGALKTGHPTRGEWRVIWADGSVHWIAGHWQAVINESGEPSRMIGVNIDVTEQKLAERELARANERLRLAIESGSVGGWDSDIKSGETLWFGKAHAQIGMTPDETSGSREEFWARVHEHDRERLRVAIQAAIHKNGEFTEEFRVVWRDGTIRWLRSRGRYYCAANGEPERILGISVDITESKQAEQALRESEQRFRLATQAGKMYSFEWNVATDRVVRSVEHADILGVAGPLRLTHQQFVDKIHPDDRARFTATIAGLSPENPIGEVTYRVRVGNGTLVWLRSSGHAFFDGEGRMLRVVGMAADVTDLKLAEDELLAVNRRLIEAQEQERARIGRELHDDINQRLALLAIELGQLREKHNNLPSEVRSHVHELQKLTADISLSVHALSHELHASTLVSLGLAKGMRSWCKQFGERQKMEIDFKSHDLQKLPQEVSLCLFRVLQEALNNASKHSGARRVEVELAANPGEIHLIVSDSGTGFDIEAARQSRGLGLTSMEERVRLVGGTIAIESKPMGGTTVHARVPLESKPRFQRTVV